MRKLLLPLALTALCGCFQVEDELAIEPQGSGSVTINVKANLFDGMEEFTGFAGREIGASAYPPLSEAAARRLFPSKDFTVKTEQKEIGGTNVLTIRATFKDIKALLTSPYAAAHQLQLQTNNGALVLRAISGMSTVAHTAFTDASENLDYLPVDAQALKTNRAQMSFEFRVRMPDAVAQANGEKSGNTVSWTAARARLQSDEEFLGKLATTMEVSCPAQGIQFAPHSPVRLALSSFPELQEQKSAAAQAAPAPEKVIAAAKLIPYRIRVSRKLDLSGETGVFGSNSELLLGVVLPEEFIPQSWGKLQLDEVVDSSGKSLMFKEDDGDQMMFGSRSFSRFGMDDDEEETSDGQSQPKEPAPRVLSAAFRAPDWKVKRINKIKGHVDLSYKGETEIVKLTNAVPADILKKGRGGDFVFDGNERGAVQHPRLRDLGMALRVEMAMEQEGFIHLTMSSGGSKTAILAAQAFDSQGKPAPTTMTNGDFDGSEDGERSFGLMISGKPKPPISLALEIGAPGGVVSLPVQFENVPLSTK